MGKRSSGRKSNFAAEMSSAEIPGISGGISGGISSGISGDVGVAGLMAHLGTGELKRG